MHPLTAGHAQLANVAANTPNSIFTAEIAA
jgi:hypothetical protein